MKGVHIMTNINNGSKLTDAEGNLVFPQTDTILFDMILILQ